MALAGALLMLIGLVSRRRIERGGRGANRA
jgi:hypothetical protein